MSNRVTNTVRLKYCGGLAWLLIAASTVTAADTGFEPFKDDSLKLWKERSFVGNTQYQLINDNGGKVLKGKATASASLLYKEFDISLLKTPILSWYWKIDEVFANTNEQARDGDDFPARVYVVYRYGRFPWQTYAINYVWASHTPHGSSWSNPYTNKSKMIAVKSGNTMAGLWQHETRNVANDFETLFDVKVESLAGIAVMVDADNTGGSAVAYFGSIQFSSQH